MIRINAFFQANEGQYESALSAALSLCAASQQHEGCVAYDVFESGTRSDVLLFCETWTTQEALEQHTKSEDFQHYLTQLENYGKMKIEQFTL